MKLTQKSIREIRKNSKNALEKRVCSYILDRWGDYDEKRYIFTDVLHYGCQSGTVGFLIYYRDTVAFYRKYRSEINALLCETMQDTGIYAMKELFGDRYDEEDPLANETHNQNLLAWFGFEETLRRIGCQFEELENYI